LHEAGYHALTLDLPGVSNVAARGFLDRDVEAGLDFLAAKAPGLPLHVWGVSAGGYWAHPVLARTRLVAGAMFEDVAPHLLEWSRRVAPQQWPAYLVFEHVLRTAYRYLDMRRHAEAFSVRAITYVSGAQDEGVRPPDTQELASHANARVQIIEGARHLESIKLANQEILALALETFAQAEATHQKRPDPGPPRVLLRRTDNGPGGETSPGGAGSRPPRPPALPPRTCGPRR